MKNYFIAITASPEVSDIVKKYKEKYARYTSNRVAPHITLIPPFHLYDSEEAQLRSFVAHAIADCKPFVVNFDSINYFQGINCVAYFAPSESSKPFLKNIFDKLSGDIGEIITNKYPDYILDSEKFTPHMTIAEIIPSEVLPEIQNELAYERIDLSFEVRSVDIYTKVEDARKWDLLYSYKLLNPQ